MSSIAQPKALLRRLVARELERRVQRLITEKHLKVVAVTGSVGKTSTKLAIASVLQQKYKVLAQAGNYNSEIGLPLSLFGMEVPGTLVNPLSWLRILDTLDKQLKADYPYEVVVLEMGADQPGDIQKFMRYIQPDIGIVTAIAPVHLEQFGSVENIAKEKMSLARGSRAVLLNAENDRVMKESKLLGGPVQTYGVDKGSVHWSSVKRGNNLKLSGRLVLTEAEIEVSTQFIGRHSLAALAAAAAVGEELGLATEQIKAGIEATMPFAGRMRVFEGLSGSTIIDDTYNAGPVAVLAALDSLRELPGRHIAILGNMNELGEQAKAIHHEVGAAAKDVDVLVTIGANARNYLAAAAAESGLRASAIHSFDSPYEAGEYVQGILKEGDVVLAKGSQNGVFAEEAVKLLLAHPSDREQLVRQSPEWLKRKAEQFQ